MVDDMVAKLVAEEGIQKGLVLSLDEGTEWVIGRDPDACQLLIEDPSASRKHLVCRKTSDGFSLQNLSKTNPILVNNEEVQTTRLLRNGDLVRIGSGLYRFYSEEEARLLDQGDVTTGDKKELNGNENHEMPAIAVVEPPEEPIINEPVPEVSDNEIKEPKNVEDEKHMEHMTDNQEALDAEVAQEKSVDQPVEEETSEGKAEEADSKEDAPKVEENKVQENHEGHEGPEGQEEHEGHEEYISIFDESSNKGTYPEINFDLTETGRWLLKVIAGPNHGAEFTMQPASSYVIGTDSNSCDIVFYDTSVSRQHAKITLNEDDTLTIEDLKSRNGTLIDGKTLTGKEVLPTNTVVQLGTSSFVVYDREGEMQTIISPLLPAIVKVLKEEPKVEHPDQAELSEAPKPAEAASVVEVPPKKKDAPHEALGAFILIAIITGLFVIIGIGTTTLFKSQPVVSQQVIHPDRDLTQALAPFPSVKYSFNRSTGRLLLVGHVLTLSDKNQLTYNLQGLNYIRNIDDSGVIIDEGVWREINSVISQNPSWKGISIHSPSPGHFIISGYLKTRKQAEQLWDYMSSNFPYLDLLEKRVIVEEDVVTSVGTILQNNGFKDVSAQMNEGEVILSGNVPAGKIADLDKALASIKEIPGVRNIKNFVSELAPEQSMINISDRYEISGVSHQGATNTSVVINGRILTRGDVLDGMTIVSIKPNVVFLEKDGTKYRIDYSH